MKKILIIDNYDSFTFNLVQYVTELEAGEVSVLKNDQLDLEKLADYDAFILSPGPGLPAESGQLMEFFQHLDDQPVLGVCLGHQAIGEHFGAELLQLDKVYHGVDSLMIQSGENYSLFDGIAREFKAGRYHSWVIREESIKNTALRVTCRDEQGIIMGVKHAEKEIHGVQFHPESVMTPDGRKMIANFLKLADKS
jgi:anthranilate synthase/aminodeoxychorismate synthase-like glutamine amidotransferase